MAPLQTPALGMLISFKLISAESLPRRPSRVAPVRSGAAEAMGLLAMMGMNEAERLEHTVGLVEPSSLAPLLTLLEALGAPRDSANEQLGVLNLTKESGRLGHFLLSARPTLIGALETLQACMAAPTPRGHQGPLTMLVILDPSTGQIWTRGQVRECAHCVERRLGERAALEARQHLDEVTGDEGSDAVSSQPLGAAAAGEVLRELLATVREGVSQD